MQATVPGKIILSGEHSIVYGAAAIAVAVSATVHARFVPTSSDRIDLIISHGRFTKKTTDLPRLKEQLDRAYTQFELGNITIAKLLKSPVELLFYTLAVAGLTVSGEIHLSSTIPIRAGMGSSAACIGALLRLSEQIQGREPASKEATAENVRYCERLQHGRGSIIDAAAVSFGGVVKVADGTIKSLPIKLDPKHWFLWNSGTALSSTGEAVAAVRAKFENSPIWQEFNDTTLLLESSITRNDAAGIKSAIADNHRLLCTIGVVPDRVRAAIERIEQTGASAKISGAGSIQSGGGGQVLVYLDDRVDQQALQALDIPLTSLELSGRGAYGE
ncbi:MAG: GHMP kinase [Gammaproteobacteria bacterium]|nr:MAG: GHMP kinase [Pseudomonadota bacterium]PIE38855.1 MAG: GHMP kinase [Gammaproteobacteria bacterium]